MIDGLRVPVKLTSRESLRMFDLADIWATRTGRDVRLVSANDHVHSRGSAHYDGKALDFVMTVQQRDERWQVGCRVYLGRWRRKLEHHARCCYAHCMSGLHSIVSALAQSGECAHSSREDAARAASEQYLPRPRTSSRLATSLQSYREAS